MLNVSYPQGKPDTEIAIGSVTLDGSSGFGNLAEWAALAFPEYYGEGTHYRGNVDTAAVVNSVLLPALSPDETIPPYRETEREPGGNKSWDEYQLSIALSPESTAALRESLENSEYPNTARFESPLSNHFRRVIQHFAREHADFEFDGE
jgi:hypothetical protein